MRLGRLESPEGGLSLRFEFWSFFKLQLDFRGGQIRR
jgi:hypothetical protein